MVIAIVDYGMGNLRSVFNALRTVGADPKIVSDPVDLRNADAIVLPGVGAFGEGIQCLRRGGFVQALEREVLHGGKPFLGICLGMQLLASTGLEHGQHTGLDWIPGVVEKIPIRSADPTLRLPHIGWNTVRFTKQDGLYAGLGDSETFYFVHSYAFVPHDQEVVSGVCSYGGEWVASLETGNIYATQFHPEKSHKTGLMVLRNFLAKIRRAVAA